MELRNGLNSADLTPSTPILYSEIGSPASHLPAAIPKKKQGVVYPHVVKNTGTIIRNSLSADR